MLRGRQRYRSHGGIPHGSTNGLGNKLAFYLQNNVGIDATRWYDQGPRGNDASQGVSGNQAELSEGGFLFTASEEDHYDFSEEVEVTNEHEVVIFVVCKLTSTGSNATVLGLNATTHFMQMDGGADNISIKFGGTKTTVSPDDGTNNDFATGTKMLITLQRESGGTGNINLWKNGVLLTQDSQAANPGDGEFISLGTRSGDRFLDGIIHDIAFVDSGADEGGGLINIGDLTIERMNTYFTSKHGIN